MKKRIDEELNEELNEELDAVSVDGEVADEESPESSGVSCPLCHKVCGGKCKGGKKLKVVILVVVLAVAGYFGYGKYSASRDAIDAKDPKVAEAAAKKEVADLVAAIGKLMILPAGETPIVATINDINALLKDQPFYTGAQNGDKVLIYQNNKKAVVYSPSRNIIVNVGPVYFDNKPSADSQPAAPSTQVAPKAETITVEVRNGSKEVGKGQKIADAIKKLDGYEIADVNPAGAKDFKGITIVNLGGKDISALETKYDVKSTTAMPEGEATTRADVLMIVGN